MSVHDAAARGYQVASESYERGRPDYPPDAVRHLVEALGIGPGAKVLDLGAGTGKLTKLLEPTGAQLFAVEPVEAMRARLEQKVPGTTVLEGTAEAIPLETGTMDAVAVAQAFHWFDGPRALAEIHRVLKPQGRLGLLWNARDESADWVAQLTRLINPHEGDAPRYRKGEWRAAFDRSTRFTPLRVRHFHHAHHGPPEMVVDRVASISFIAALPAPSREDVLAEVRHLLATHPGVRGLAEVSLPYRTDVFVCAATSPSSAGAPGSPRHG